MLTFDKAHKDQNKAPTSPNLTWAPENVSTEQDDIPGLSFEIVRVHYNCEIIQRMRGIPNGMPVYVGGQMGKVVSSTKDSYRVVFFDPAARDFVESGLNPVKEFSQELVTPAMNHPEQSTETAESIAKLGIISPKDRADISVEAGGTTEDGSSGTYAQTDYVCVNSVDLTELSDFTSVVDALVYNKNSGAVPVSLEDGRYKRPVAKDVSDTMVTRTEYTAVELEEEKTASFSVKDILRKARVESEITGAFIDAIKELLSAKAHSSILVIAEKDLQEKSTHPFFEDKVPRIETSKIKFILIPEVMGSIMTVFSEAGINKDKILLVGTVKHKIDVHKLGIVDDLLVPDYYGGLLRLIEKGLIPKVFYSHVVRL